MKLFSRSISATQATHLPTAQAVPWVPGGALKALYYLHMLCYLQMASCIADHSPESERPQVHPQVWMAMHIWTLQCTVTLQHVDKSQPANGTGRNMQAEICKYAEANLPMETKGERRIGLSGQLPLAATVPPKEPNKDEWWTTLGHSSLDVSAILQRAFPKAHTGSEVAKQDGMFVAHCSGVKQGMQTILAAAMYLWDGTRRTCCSCTPIIRATCTHSTLALHLQCDCHPSTNTCVFLRTPQDSN